MRDYVMFVSLALFWVYEQRQNRWYGFIKALEGTYVLPSKASSSG